MLDYEARVSEIEVYFAFLADVVAKGAKLHYPRARKTKQAAISEDLVKILKANALLILYNLVESSIRNGLNEIYDSVKADKVQYEVLRQELRELWVHDEFKPDPMRLPENNAKRVIEMLELVISSKRILFDSKLLPISGNLDAERVRELSAKYGFSHQTTRSTKGGYHLTRVRQERNNLAHGLKSFKECGRDLTLDALIEIKRQVVLYIRQILKNIQRFVDRRQYCVRGQRARTA
ncbi:MAG TPA: MAE_28990/MAE_18760 family HEPN-like nuclease [Candidatus Solibacter sp.]|nr:MAE_28990/MAE_18760 family HEPN-like nuclease [Candidatus Solibacter sp.]